MLITKFAYLRIMNPQFWGIYINVMTEQIITEVIATYSEYFNFMHAC